MKIKTKYLWTIYIFIALFSISVLSMSFYLHTLISKSTNNILHYTNKLEMLSQLELALSKVIMPANDYLIHGDEDERYTFEELDENVNKYFSLLEEQHVPTRMMMEGREIFNKLKSQYVQIKALSDKIFSIPDPIGNVEGAQLMEEMDLLMDNMIDDAKGLHKYCRLDVLVEVEVINVHFYRNMVIVLSIFGFVIIVLIIYGLFLTKGIIVPIERLIEYMSYVSKGNLDRRLDIKTNDEIGKLDDSFNKITDNLVEANVKKEQALTESKEARNYSENLIEIAKDAIVGINENGIVNVWNKAAEKIFGYLKGEIIGQQITTIIPEQYKKQHKDGLQRFVRTGEPRIINNTVEVSGITKKGIEVPIEMSIAFQKNEECIYTFLAIIRDLTARKELEQLQKNTMEEREKTIRSLKQLMEFSTIMREEVLEVELIKHMAHALKKNFNPDFIVVLMLNREKDVLDVPLIEPQMPVEKIIKAETFINPSICRVIRTGHKLIVRDISKDIPCECISLTIKDGGYACYPLITGGITTGVVLLVKKEMGHWDGEERLSLFSTYVGLVASALHGVRLMDITKHAAVTDGLTGVYNRRFFDEMLEKQILLSMRRKVSLSLLIMDIDHFKNFNDTYGHIAGDRVLKQLTMSVSESIRNSDILARYGGEEFVIIMPEAGLSNALKKADEVRRNVESMNLENIVSEQTLSMTISIGVASFPEHGADFNTLVASADSALYKAKEAGRNRVEVP